MPAMTNQPQSSQPKKRTKEQAAADAQAQGPASSSSNTNNQTTDTRSAGAAQQQASKEQSQLPFPDMKMEESMLAPGRYRPLPEEEVLEWTAPSRPFKKHNKKYFSTVAVIALLISLILGFAGQLVAVTVVIAMSFVIYALSVVPPQDSTYKITTYGIRIDEALYYWEEMGYFWFGKKQQQQLLYIEVARFPGRLTILLGDQEQEVITDILSEVLINKKPEPTVYEKTSNWLQEKIPLDLDE